MVYFHPPSNPLAYKKFVFVFNLAPFSQRTALKLFINDYAKTSVQIKSIYVNDKALPCITSEGTCMGLKAFTSSFVIVGKNQYSGPRSV